MSLQTSYECRSQCGACCISPSIERAYYGMPHGKAAGETCRHLDPKTFRCALWGTEHYPSTCKAFAPEPAVCGENREEAIRLITQLEVSTNP